MSESINFGKQISKQMSEKDIVIDLHNNLRSSLIKINLKAKKVSIPKNRIFKLALTTFQKNIYGKNLSIPQIYFDTANKAIALHDDGLGLGFWLESDKSAGKYLPFERQYSVAEEPKIAIAPGATYFTKRWLPENFLKVAEMLKEKYNAEITLVGGESDVELCNFIEQNFKHGAIYNQAGKLNLVQSATLIRESDLLLTNDTGMMHVAAAMQTPVVAIFGSSVKDLGFTPYRTPNVVLESELDCRPCSHIGRNSCPKGHFKCMKTILPEHVATNIAQLLQK
jgi:heptosyltransferase-2